MGKLTKIKFDEEELKAKSKLDYGTFIVFNKESFLNFCMIVTLAGIILGMVIYYIISEVIWK